MEVNTSMTRSFLVILFDTVVRMTQSVRSMINAVIRAMGTARAAFRLVRPRMMTRVLT